MSIELIMHVASLYCFIALLSFGIAVNIIGLEDGKHLKSDFGPLIDASQYELLACLQTGIFMFGILASCCAVIAILKRRPSYLIPMEVLVITLSMNCICILIWYIFRVSFDNSLVGQFISWLLYIVVYMGLAILHMMMCKLYIFNYQRRH